MERIFLKKIDKKFPQKGQNYPLVNLVLKIINICTFKKVVDNVLWNNIMHVCIILVK